MRIEERKSPRNYVLTFPFHQQRENPSVQIRLYAHCKGTGTENQGFSADCRPHHLSHLSLPIKSKSVPLAYLLMPQARPFHSAEFLVILFKSAYLGATKVWSPSLAVVIRGSLPSFANTSISLFKLRQNSVVRVEKFPTSNTKRYFVRCGICVEHAE